MAGKELPVVPPVTKRENRGGYDCEFVTPPPDAIQTECPVCLTIPKEPCVISCPCGKELCRECIERIKKDNKPCPLCNLTDFTFLRHHGSERYLKAQEVWCSHKKDGCRWQGKLKELENHLYSQKGNLSGCQFVALECMNSCGEWFQRRYITVHQTEQCMKRPYSCQYCQAFQSTFDDVSQNHYQKCSKYPVDCPNECREDPFKREELEGHLQDHCPLTEVNCPLHYAGCVVKLPRKDMLQHMKVAATEHVIMLSSVTAYLLNENRALHQSSWKTNQQYHELEQVLDVKEYRCQELEEMLEGITSKSESLERKLQATEEKLQATVKKCDFLYAKQEDTEMRLNTVYAQCEQNHKVLEGEVQDLKIDTYQLHMSLGDLPIDFKVNFSCKEDVYLPPFYSHIHGYRMCLHVCPCGCSKASRAHVSLFTHLMQGPYDDHLKWPFRGEITIQIVNQAGDYSHVEETIPYNDNTSLDAAVRVIDKEKAIGQGFYCITAHTDLQYNAAKKTQYLKDNIIIVRVVAVKIT